MPEFLDKTFYGNTILEWLIALLIVAASFSLAKIVYWIFSQIIKKITLKTKSKLDDIIIDMIEEPLVLAIVITGFWYGSEYLKLSDGFIEFRTKVFYILITFNIAWFVVRLLDAIIVEYLTPLVEKSDGDLDDQLLPIIRKSLKTIIWIIAVVVGLNNAGYDVGALIAGLGIGGLALAMAAKDSVANLFGGVMIFTDKPFILKDRIKIAGVDGVVKEIGVRSTRLTTLEGRTVTIPNSKFTDSVIENITSEPSRKIVITLGLTYDTSPENMNKAQEIIKDAINKNESTEDAVTVGFTGFGSFSLDILVVYYIKSGEDIVTTQNNINLEILSNFNKEKIEFAFPTQTIISQNKEI